MKPAAPTPDDVAAVTQALARSQARWIKGRELARLAGVPGRKIRLVAQHTGEIISGQQGYCLTERATWGELSQSRRDLESRARQMVERGHRSYELALIANRAPHWTAIARIPCQQNMPFKMTPEKRWSRLVQSVHLCAGRRATKHRINTSLRNKHLGDTTRPIREQSNCAAPFWSSILGEGFKPESQDNCGGITAQDADNARGHAR